ncbi:hypothetical protein MMPV_000417 [Pyropia vietnamensis]
MAAEPPPDASPSPEVTLYSVPVSNYAARVRFVAYAKGLVADGTVAVVPPSAVGGLSSAPYRAVHPFGKMPAAVVHARNGGGDADGSGRGGDDLMLYESAVLVEYLADAYEDVGPSFLPATSAARARARLVVAVLNEYVGPHHPVMYKALDGMDAAGRAAGVARLCAGLDAVEAALDAGGPYAAGDCLSVADAALLGNWPFYAFMLPTFFGTTPTDGRPRLAAWAQHLLASSPAAQEVYAEVHAALVKWWEGGRWEKLGMDAVAPPPGLPF